MKIKKILIILIGLTLLLSGCNQLALKAGYQKKSEVVLEIDKLKKDKQDALDDQKAKIEKAKDDYYSQLKSNFQQTVNWTYGASLASNLKSNKTRLDNIIDLRISTALSFGMAPTPEAIIEQNKTLKEELDETRVTNQELTKRYNDKEKEAQDARKSEEEKNKKIEEVRKEGQLAVDKIQVSIDGKQNELNKINDKLITTEQNLSAKSASLERLKKTIMMWLFGGAALCAIGTYFFRAWELAVGAAICTGLAIAIPFIEPWMVLTALLATVVVGGVAIYLRSHTEKKIGDRALGAIQEVRNESEETYQKVIQPKLTDWFSDAKNLDKRVESKLKELNVK